MRKYISIINNSEADVVVDKKGININGEIYKMRKEENYIIESSNGNSVLIDDVIPIDDEITRVEVQGYTIDVIIKNPMDLAILSGDEEQKVIVSPLAGIVSKVFVQQGESIKKGDVLLIISAMKMENKIVAKVNGTIKCINIVLNDQINQGSTLLELE